jgi:thiamine biosynthesis lipoprotein
MEALGFDREHTTGTIVRTSLDAESRSYRDVRVGPDTVTLTRPLLLDLGGVAKGLAIDLAAKELQPFRHFAIDAGGDLYLGGQNREGGPWAVGVRHPRSNGTLLTSLRVSDTAVCTSGDYERRTANRGGHHLIDPDTRRPVDSVVSATVVAPSAMTADALATAAFVLGPEAGIELLHRQGVSGLIVTSDLSRHMTSGFGDLCCE